MHEGLKKVLPALFAECELGYYLGINPEGLPIFKLFDAGTIDMASFTEPIILDNGVVMFTGIKEGLYLSDARTVPDNAHAITFNDNLNRFKIGPTGVFWMKKGTVDHVLTTKDGLLFWKSTEGGHQVEIDESTVYLCKWVGDIEQ